MTRLHPRALALAALVLGLVLPAGAGAQSVEVPIVGGGAKVGLRSIPAHLAGQLTVDFHGDAASACAGHGLCGYAGTVTWRPPSTGQLEVFTSRGRVVRQLYLLLLNAGPFAGPPGGVTTSHVVLVGPGTVTASSQCVDATSSDPQLSLPIRHGRVSFTLAGPGRSVLATRCAGPLASDIQPEIPTPTLTLSRIARGNATIDMTASTAFSSNGFAGTVESTLTISLGRPGRIRHLSSGPLPVPTRRFREVKAIYHASVAGNVVESIRGDADPGVCSLLGSCGALGTLTLTPRTVKAQGQLIATAPIGRPYQDLLRALGLSHRGNAKGITVLGGVSWAGGGTVQSALGQGAATCTDSAPLGPGNIVLAAARGEIGAEYASGAAGTRCPGPEFTTFPPLALGSASLAGLARRTATISLTRGRALTDYGYTGHTVPHLTLTLTRARVTSSVFVAPAGAF